MNSYLYRRSDGIILDGRIDSGISQQMYQSALAKSLLQKGHTPLCSQNNPYALSHMVNHSPERSNVAAFSFDFPLYFEPSLRGLIPNLHFAASPPGDPVSSIRSFS